MSDLHRLKILLNVRSPNRQQALYTVHVTNFIPTKDTVFLFSGMETKVWQVYYTMYDSSWLVHLWPLQVEDNEFDDIIESFEFDGWERKFEEQPVPSLDYDDDFDLDD